MKRYIIPYTGGNAILQVIALLKPYYPIKIINWDNMTQATRLIEIRNATAVGINKGGIPGVTLENDKIENYSKPENFGKGLVILNPTAINRKWINIETLDGAKFNGYRYSIAELSKLVEGGNRQVYITDLPHEHLSLSDQVRMMLTKKRPLAEIVKYTSAQIRKITGPFKISDPWNNVCSA